MLRLNMLHKEELVNILLREAAVEPIVDQLMLEDSLLLWHTGSHCSQHFAIALALSVVVAVRICLQNRLVDGFAVAVTAIAVEVEHVGIPANLISTMVAVRC